LFALALSCRLVAVADALLGMVNIDLLLLPLQRDGKVSWRDRCVTNPNESTCQKQQQQKNKKFDINHLQDGMGHSH
jgi:hypothetical protein